MAKLSAKQRYYANQAKKGKITKAQAASFGVSEKNKPKTTSKVSSSTKKYSSVNDVYAKEGYMISPEHAEYLYNNQQAYTPQNSAWEASPERRAQASKASKTTSTPIIGGFQMPDTNVGGGKVLGASTSKPNIKVSNPTSLGKGLQWANEALGYGYGKLTGAENPMLGLSQQLMGGDTGWTEKLQNILGLPANAALRSDYESGGDYRNPQTVSAINPWDVGTGAEDRARAQQIAAGNENPTTNYGTGFTTGYGGGGKISDVIDSGNNNDNRRTSSRPVSNPTPIFQPSQSSNISQIFGGGSPQSAPQDFSNNTQSIDPSRRQLLGNGYFSNGIASNGKGDYGIEGAMTGTGGNQLEENNPLDDLLTVLGIKPQTAMAADTNMFPQTQSMTSLFQPKNDYANSQLYRDTMDRLYGQSNQDVETAPPVATTQNQGGGVAQQFAQAPQTNPATQYYQDSIKGYGKQEKDTERAYKKALKEMLKGIESQYKTSETTGVNDLNKQKVNDLQALASRFSFGLNQDPNSEQAVQYSQRTQNDYAGQLSDFLAKLAAAKTQDISSARSGNQSQLMQALQSIQGQRSSAQEKLANMLSQMQSQKRGGGGSSTQTQKMAAYYSPDGSYTFNEVDPASGLKVFYDPQTNEPFING